VWSACFSWVATNVEQPICHALEASHYECENFDERRELSQSILGEDRNITLMAEGDCKPTAPKSAIMLDGFPGENTGPAKFRSIVSYQLRERFGGLQAFDIRLENDADRFEY